MATYAGCHQTPSLADNKKVVEFLQTYAEANAILLPGQIPGYKLTDVQLLPSNTIKRQVWQQHCTSVVSGTHHQVAYFTFGKICRRVVPYIMVTKPMSDHCSICQSNSTAIMWSANQPEEQKLAVSPIQTPSLFPALCRTLLFQHGTTGALPLRPSPTRPHILPHSSQVCNPWGML